MMKVKIELRIKSI